MDLSKRNCVDRAHLVVTELDLGGGGDNVGLVHPSQGDTVDFERASNQQKAAIQLLQEHHALSPEPSSQQDEDGAGGDRGSDLCGVGDLAGDFWPANVLRWVVSGGLLGGDETLAGVLGTADLLLGVSRGCVGVSLAGESRLGSAGHCDCEEKRGGKKE